MSSCHYSSSCSRSAPRRAGFTLVELLVVVSIIALLIAILLPSMNAAREQTRWIKCQANARSIGNGVQLYVQDHRVLPGPLHPPIFRRTALDDPRFNDMPEDTQRIWFLLYRLAPYFSKADHFLEYVEAVSVCPTSLKVKRDEDFIPEDLGGPAGNPSWSHPYNYLPNTWGNTKPAFYFGWVNTGVTWRGFSNAVAQRPKPVEVSARGEYLVVLPPGWYFAPLPLERVQRPSDEWMLSDAWHQVKNVFVSPTERYRRPLGPWQDLGGASRIPLPDKPYHGSDKLGTSLTYFDGHGGTFKGIDEWAVKFPASRWTEADSH